MNAFDSPTVDVRDMICAQALAQADRAIRRLQPGESLTVICNAADVERDLSVWAKEVGHRLVSTEQRPDAIRLRLVRG